MDMEPSKISVVDVAREAGVSPGTVSRVMTHKADVDPEIARRVFLASRRIGFVPKISHQCVAVVASPQSPLVPMGYTNSMIAALTQHLSEHQYTLELVELNELELTERAHVRGVIALVCDSRIMPLLDIPNLPVLSVNERMTERGFHSVCTDHFQQGELATTHLLEHGHRRIAFLESSSHGWGSRQRRAGYESALKKTGLTPDPALIQYVLGTPLYDTLAQLRKKEATALVNFSEHAGLDAIHILTNILRVSIPKDISVVTMENLPVFQYLSPAHTVVRQPLDDLAKVVAEQMIELCRKRRNTKGERTRPLPAVVDITLPCELIARESVAQIGG